MRRRLYDREEHGFTLIELLVVIIILGILAAVVVFAVSGVGDKGKSSATVIDDRTIRTAEEAYCAKNSRYASGQELVDGGFLSNAPQYHAVNARQTNDPGSGNCNGWKYFVTRTGQAQAYGTGRWDNLSSAPPGSTQALVRLPDGNVYTRGVNGGANVATLWNPSNDTWTSQEPPPYVGLGGNTPGGSADLLLVDDPQTPYSECKGAVDNCGKVLAFGSLLFDPRVPVGSGQWQDLSPAGAEITGCNVCDLGFRGNFSFVQIKGTPAQCGVNCGKIAFFTQPGAHTGNPYGVQPDSYDLFDPRANTYQTFQFSGVGFTPPITGQAVMTLFNNGTAQLPDGRIFACCNSSKSAFMNIVNLAPTVVEGPLPPGPYTRSVEYAPLSTLANSGIYVGHHTSRSSTVTYMPTSGGQGFFSVGPNCAKNPITGANLQCFRIAILPDGRILATQGRANITTQEFYMFNHASGLWSRVADSNLLSSVNRSDGLYLDPHGGPCGSFCSKVLMISDTAEVFTP